MPATTRTSGRIFQQRERLDQRHKTLLFPIVSHQDENKRIVSKSELFADVRPVAKPQFPVENLVVEANVNHRQRFIDSVVALQIGRCFFGDQDQARFRIGVHVALEKNNQRVIKSPVNQPGPEADGIAQQLQFRRGHADEFGEHDVDGDQIGIPAVGSGRINQVARDSAKMGIPPAPHMVGRKPPNKIDQVRTVNLRNAVPSHAREIDIFHALAVNMNLVVLREARDPFGDAPLGPVPLVDEGRNNRDPDWPHSCRCSLRMDLLAFTPLLENQRAPDARPVPRACYFIFSRRALLYLHAGRHPQP